MNSSPRSPIDIATRAGTRDWSQRCANLFEDLRKPARNMVSRAYGRALTDEEIEDIYAAAWAATLSALRDRGSSMADEELRAYVLTAVASHASKELRRRTRKPVGTLDTAHDQVVSDVHLPLPDEAAIGSESAGIARDLLLSLPPRRRAVMLLRYGWGLTPKEICALVEGLSPRAYRKEVTKGVDQLISRLKLVETGEWCESREPLLRDYVAGTADQDARRQVEEHLGHCRACSKFAGSLSGHLHDFGAGMGFASAAGVIGAKGGFMERIVGLLDGGRSAATSAVERGESAVATVATSGAGRGSGAAGAGLLAKVAAGGAGKAALACIGTGAAATACVAAGVVPGISLNGWDSGGGEPERRTPAKVTNVVERRAPRVDPEPITGVVQPVAPAAPAAVDPEAGESKQDVRPEGVGKPKDVQPEPEPSSQPTVPAPVEEFDPVAPPSPTPTAAPAPAPSSSSTPASSGSSTSSGGSSAGATSAGEEFGP